MSKLHPVWTLRCMSDAGAAVWLTGEQHDDGACMGADCPGRLSERAPFFLAPHHLLQGKGTVKNKRGDLISCLLTFDP